MNPETIVASVESLSESRTIAIAIDESHFSAHAFEWALDNVIHNERDEVLLINVRKQSVNPITFGVPSDYDEFDRINESNKQASHDIIHNFANKLAARKIKYKGISAQGEAKEEIVSLCNTFKVTMLIIGSRGMGKVKRAFIGSVSDYCVHHCNCSVVTVK